MSCKKYFEDDCNGCACHLGQAPCWHCTEDHNNVDNHPECEDCGDVLHDMTEMEQLKHKINCFKLL